jgi:peptidoglycan/xylan/chitin deacetylase (PgdA/CDA1 family)
LKLLFGGTLVLSVLATIRAVAGETKPMRIALIFDDGPIPGQTEKFLALLAQEHVQVTFASVAKNVESYPSAARATVAAGHEIVNHSYAHLHARDLDDAMLKHEIAGAQKVIAEKVGVAPKWYWPPFLESDDRVRTAARKVGIRVYVPGHLVVSEDYKPEVSAEEIKRRATSGIVNGTVIVFHEWRNETLDQMPVILAELKRQGCVFLTFSELAAQVGSDANADSK